MSKELFIAAHEQLVEEYLEKFPDATESEAYKATSDAAWDRASDNLGGMIDRARMLHKERA